MFRDFLRFAATDHQISVAATLIILPSVLFSVAKGEEYGYLNAFISSLQITVGLIAAGFAIGAVIFCFKWIKNFRKISRL